MRKRREMRQNSYTEDAISGTHNIIDFKSSYDPEGPYDTYKVNGDIEQAYLDSVDRSYYAELPDCETEEDLQKSIFKQEFQI
ncbi:Protein of unknown function [Pyronema omphalodes CBS 100304]|uniref:Uncharacterized protein n=1 Tax=Pyronema omphalodes (strain CBS 100304) TaxID=1076935 RepID=U4LRL1_PYROM|nr:Protein of unknown function [Pyronema omphalodes CBS 100304]